MLENVALVSDHLWPVHGASFCKPAVPPNMLNMPKSASGQKNDIWGLTHYEIKLIYYLYVRPSVWRFDCMAY